MPVTFSRIFLKRKIGRNLSFHVPMYIFEAPKVVAIFFFLPKNPKKDERNWKMHENAKKQVRLYMQYMHRNSSWFSGTQNIFTVWPSFSALTYISVIQDTTQNLRPIYEEERNSCAVKFEIFPNSENMIFFLSFSELLLLSAH